MGDEVLVRQSRGGTRHAKYIHVIFLPMFHRFAQFFICPLFNADAQDREVNAVESGENALA